jgi:hypothetical protein
VRRTRLHRALPALLLAAALLAACGDETTSDGSDREPDAASEESPQLNPRTASFAVLDDARAELALLSQGNLGAAFEADPSSDDDELEDPDAETPTGCDADVTFQDRLDPDGLALGDADIDYWLMDDVRLMAVTSAVSSFGDETTAEAAFGALYEDIGECTHFEDASEDGSETTVIDVTIDTDTATEDVDDQFDMVGGGTWSFDGQSIPLGVGFAIARVDSNVTMVVLLSIGVTEDNELLAPYTEIAADRLAQVAAGETPTDVAAPLPSAVPPVRAPIERTPATLDGFYASAPGILGD